MAERRETGRDAPHIARFVRLQEFLDLFASHAGVESADEDLARLRAAVGCARHEWRGVE